MHILDMSFIDNSTLLLTKVSLYKYDIIIIIIIITISVNATRMTHKNELKKEEK